MSTSSTPTTSADSLTIAQEIKKGEEAGDLNDTSVRYLAYLGRLRPLVQPYTFVLPSSFLIILMLIWLFVVFIWGCLRQ